MILRWLAWWAGSLALWLLLTARVSPNEALPGIAAAAVAATAAEIVRAKGAFGFRARASWLEAALHVPRHVVRDTFVVFHALVARRLVNREQPRGSFRSIPMPVDGDEATRGARNLLVTIGISLSPNTYVVGVDPETGRVLIHQLVPERPSSVADLVS